jgi:kynurenine formamidase
MSVLKALTDAIRDSSVEVIDLTAPLTSDTPIINLPEPFGNTARFTLTEITDAGAAHSFDPPFPCHSALLGAGKYGLTQLRNLGRLPATGAVVVTGPLPIVSGSGSPCRALALVERS